MAQRIHGRKARSRSGSKRGISGFRKFLRENGLSIMMFGLFVVFLLGQSVSGHLQYNDELRDHGRAAITWRQYLSSGEFVESVFENWESEFLQMGLYVVFTAFLFQRGSAESKKLKSRNEVDEEPTEESLRKGGHRLASKGAGWRRIYSHSLSFALLALFAFSFIGHAIGGAREYNREQELIGKVSRLSAVDFVGTPRFWFESFQNWQSEFLSVGVLIVLSIFLREKGSQESKPVAAPNDEEGE